MNQIPAPSVSLLLYGDRLSNEEVTATLGVQPDQSVNSGDTRRSGKNAFTYRKGCWCLSSKTHVASESIGDHLRWLSQAVALSQIKRVRGADEIVLAIYFVTGDEVSGLSIPPDSVAFAAAVGARIDVHIDYWHGCS